MRVWLVDDRKGDAPGSLEALLRQLAGQAEGRLALLGAGPFRPGLVAELRDCPFDLLVVHGPSWPEEIGLQDVFAKDVALVAATAPERCSRFLALAELHPVWLVPPAPGLDDLQLALLGAFAAQRRHARGKTELARLQQRLSDRIVVEKAKGILVQRLGITEEEAYKRLRLLSRRQRRQIRDIAQSLLDTEWLLLPEVNGALDFRAPDDPAYPQAPFPPA
jgi:hypothetical protein